MLIRCIENYLLYGLDETGIIKRIERMPLSEKDCLRKWLRDVFETCILNESDPFCLRVDSASFQLSALMAGGSAVAAFMMLPFTIPMATVSAMAVGGIVGFGMFRRVSAPERKQARKEVDERIAKLALLLSSNINPLRIPQGG